MHVGGMFSLLQSISNHPSNSKTYHNDLHVFPKETLDHFRHWSDVTSIHSMAICEGSDHRIINSIVYMQYSIIILLREEENKLHIYIICMYV